MACSALMVKTLAVLVQAIGLIPGWVRDFARTCQFHCRISTFKQVHKPQSLGERSSDLKQLILYLTPNASDTEQ